MMPDAKGQPLPGEWWQSSSGKKLYIIGKDSEGRLIYQVGDAARRLQTDSSGWDDCQHLPDCTGWDWVAPDWVELTPDEYGWHVLRRGVDQCRHVN